MAETPNFGFYAVQPDDMSSNLIDVMQALNGSGSTSNIMRIDALIKTLQDKKTFIVVESDSSPTNLSRGDEWDYVLGEYQPDVSVFDTTLMTFGDINASVPDDTVHM